ncbi:MAG: maleylpyruvate isomerase family mycothiol-dependent enzyme [Jatrophihabitantaceae bacterium]
MAESIWPTIHAERRALAADLAGLSAEQWQQASLCPDWNVHQVLAHLLALAKMTPAKFIAGFTAHRFDFHTFIGKLVAEESASAPAQTLAAFRAAEPRQSSPPAPPTTWLGENFIHGEDIRRPLGIRHEYPVAAVTRVITYYSKLNALLGAKKRIAGLTLAATDTDYTIGSGPRVEGPAMTLLMATAGRSAVLDELAGPGLDLLRQRP